MSPIGTGIRQFVESFRYAYPSARAKALKSFLLTEEQFKKIVISDNLKDAIHVLSETTYGSSLSGIDRAIEIEAMLYKNFAETLAKILSFLPSSSKPIFQRYLEKYEAENIKAIMVGVRANIPRKKIQQMLFPMYINLNVQQYEKMTSSKTVEEVVSAISDTIYNAALDTAIKEYERSLSMLSIDTSLDAFVYKRIFEMISTSTGDGVESLKRMIGVEIDIKNIKSILRLRSSITKPSDTVSYLIPRGAILNLKILEELAAAVDMEEMISRLQKTKYYDYLIKNYKLFEKATKEKRLSMLERALDNLQADIGKQFERDYPLGIGPILGYVIAKTIEVRKIVAIMKLKEEGFSEREIEEAMS